MQKADIDPFPETNGVRRCRSSWCSMSGCTMVLAASVVVALFSTSCHSIRFWVCPATKFGRSFWGKSGPGAFVYRHWSDNEIAAYNVLVNHLNAAVGLNYVKLEFQNIGADETHRMLFNNLPFIKSASTQEAFSSLTP